MRPKHKKSENRAILLFLQSLIKSVWLFPVVLLLIISTLTVLKISGSSVNVYDQLLNYREGKDNTIYGEPRTVRSDEWLVNTPFTVSQSENNFPATNQDAVNGQDVSLGVDVPYREWSTLFKPQNLAFFVLPLEYAFAFKWWIIAFVLAMAIYIFVLFLLPKQRFAAAALAVFTVMNPFIQWWYVSGTLLPIAYTLIGVVLAYKITQSRDMLKLIGGSVLLAYCLICFALILYPPYLLVCAGVGLVLFLSIYLGLGNQFKDLLKNKTWAYLGTIVITVVCVVFAFLVQHREAVAAISSTSYPGSRSVPAGDIGFASSLIWPLSHTTLSQNSLTSFENNQSEVSRFLLFGIVLIPFIGYGLYRTKKSWQTKEYRLLLYLFIGAVAALVLLSARAFIPYGDRGYKLLHLDGILPTRLLIGVGIINLVLLIIAMKLPTKPWRGWKFSVDKHLIIVFASVFALIESSLLWVKLYYVLPSVGLYEITGMSLLIASIVTLLAHTALRVRYVGLTGMLVYAIVISFPINPLYAGMGALTESDLSKQVSMLSTNDNSTWISTKSTFSPILLASGAKTLSGVQIYPKNEVWSKYFPNDEKTYNRYAHITYTIDDNSTKRALWLLQPDAFEISLHSCDEFLKEQNINYILTAGKLEDFQCFDRIEDTTLGDTHISIHKRSD